MKFLLDTHTLLWWLSDNPTLTNEARNAIANGENLIFVSAVSAWEIAIKKAIGKLVAPDDLASALVVNAFQSLPITIEHGIAAGVLPQYHKDPFDRMLVAQAKLEQLTIITRDPQFIPYGEPIISA